MTLLALAGVLVALALLGHTARLAQSWWTPAHAFSLTWVVMLLGSQYAMGGALAPSAFALVVLTAAWWCFLFGSLAVFRIVSSWAGVPTSQQNLKPNVAPALLIALVGLQALAVYLEVRQSGIAVPGSVDELADLRISHELQTMESLPFLLGIFRWGHVLYIPLAFALYAKGGRSRLWWAVPVLVALALGSVKFTRAPLLQVAVVALWSWHAILRPSRRKRLAAITVSAALVVAAFFLFQDRLVGVDPNALYDTSEAVWAYVVAPAKAFGELLENPGLFGDLGPYSLDSLYFLLFKLSIIEGYSGLIRPFVAVPMPTNLFTFLDAYTADAGVPGALLGAFLTGAFGAVVYAHAMRTRRVGPIVLGAYVMYCSLMAPANNEFIRIALPIYVLLAWAMDRIVTLPADRAPASSTSPMLPAGGPGPLG